MLHGYEHMHRASIHPSASHATRTPHPTVGPWTALCQLWFIGEWTTFQQCLRIKPVIINNMHIIINNMHKIMSKKCLYLPVIPATPSKVQGVCKKKGASLAPGVAWGKQAGGGGEGGQKWRWQVSDKAHGGWAQRIGRQHGNTARA